ncbi:hypothetical protein SRHO_G00103360 [Serrasalmus rhombeus]
MNQKNLSQALRFPACGSARWALLVFRLAASTTRRCRRDRPIVRRRRVSRTVTGYVTWPVTPKADWLAIMAMRARSRNHAPVVQRQIGKDPGDPDHPQPIRNSGDLRPHAPTATACTPQRTKNGGPRQSAHRQRASDRRARGNEQPTPPGRPTSPA